MRRWAMLAILAAMLALAPASRPASAADPFSGRQTPAETGAGGGIGGGAVLWLIQEQRRLNQSISDAFHAVEEKHSRAAFALILGLAFLYGMLHAIGPGHGKSIVASYFVSRHARWTSGVAMGSMISVIQGLTAIVLVGLLALLLQLGQFDILGRATLVEFISYGLIAVLGAVMFYRAATGKLHSHDPGEPEHDHHGHDHGHAHHHRPARLDRRLIVATGLTPCASAIIILLFALANHALGLGVIAVSALTVGMAVTLSAIGILTVLGRRALVAMVDSVGIQSHRLEQPLAMIAALVIVGVSALMMYGAWLRL
jgi:nickel/cobalt transporter (NicO) family protein